MGQCAIIHNVRLLAVLVMVILAGCCIGTRSNGGSLELLLDLEDLTLQIFISLLQIVGRARVDSFRVHAAGATQWRRAIGAHLARNML